MTRTWRKGGALAVQVEHIKPTFYELGSWTPEGFTIELEGNSSIALHREGEELIGTIVLPDTRPLFTYKVLPTSKNWESYDWTDHIMGWAHSDACLLSNRLCHNDGCGPVERPLAQDHRQILLWLEQYAEQHGWHPLTIDPRRFKADQREHLNGGQ